MILISWYVKLKLPLLQRDVILVLSLGVRLLVERRGRLHLLRITILGKLQSDHVLPMHPPAVCGASSCQPHLTNYGDASFFNLECIFVSAIKVVFFIKYGTF